MYLQSNRTRATRPQTTISIAPAGSAPWTSNYARGPASHSFSAVAADPCCVEQAESERPNSDWTVGFPSRCCQGRLVSPSSQRRRHFVHFARHYDQNCQLSDHCSSGGRLDHGPLFLSTVGRPHTSRATCHRRSLTSFWRMIMSASKILVMLRLVQVLTGIAMLYLNMRER